MPDNTIILSKTFARYFMQVLPVRLFSTVKYGFVDTQLIMAWLYFGEKKLSICSQFCKLLVLHLLNFKNVAEPDTGMVLDGGLP